MALFLSRLVVPTAALALVASPALAQRPTLTGEKATVAEAVKADLARLADLQNRHHERSRVYAADARDLNFSPTSGAQVNVAYASMNAWAANATHPVLSPIACFIIISSAESTGPAAAPFCQEGRPGTGTFPAASPPATQPAALPAPGAAPAPAGPTTAAPAFESALPDAPRNARAMTYQAGDFWRVPRAVARQYDVLSTPLTLYARFTVGRREDSRTLAISLLSMDLQARGQSVQRWDGASR